MSEYSPEPVGRGARFGATWSSPAFDLERDARIEAGRVRRTSRRSGTSASGSMSVAARRRRSSTGPSHARASEGTRFFAGGWAANEARSRELEQRGFRAGPVLEAHADRASTAAIAGAHLAGGHPASGPFRRATSARSTRCSRKRSRTRGSRSRTRSRTWSHYCSQSPVVRSGALVSRSPGQREPPGFAICKVHPGDDGSRVGADPRRATSRGAAAGSVALCFSTRSTQFRRLGLRHAGLGVDAESLDRAPCRLYESVGMRRGRLGSRFARRSSRELAPCALPELPDVHGGRGRRRLRVPQLRKRRSRPGSCASLRAWGAGRRGNGRRRARRASLSRGRRRRARHARRAERGGRRGARGAADRARRMLLHACRSRAGLARRVDRLGIVWIDAHGDLNTPETSPSGNLWGMPFRMLLDGGRRRARGRRARRRAQPRSAGGRVRRRRPGSTTRSTARSRASTRAYVALDLDVLDPSEVDVLIPEPDGLPPTRSRRSSGTSPAGRRSPEWASPASSRPSANAALAARMLAAAGF